MRYGEVLFTKLSFFPLKFCCDHSLSGSVDTDNGDVDVKTWPRSEVAAAGVLSEVLDWYMDD